MTCGLHAAVHTTLLPMIPFRMYAGRGLKGRREWLHFDEVLLLTLILRYPELHSCECECKELRCARSTFSPPRHLPFHLSEAPHAVIFVKLRLFRRVEERESKYRNRKEAGMIATIFFSVRQHIPASLHNDIRRPHHLSAWQPHLPLQSRPRGTHTHIEALHEPRWTRMVPSHRTPTLSRLPR